MTSCAIDENHWRTIGAQEVCAIEAVRLRKRYGALGCANTLFSSAHHWRKGASNGTNTQS
jgi:hypothetical protein